MQKKQVLKFIKTSFSKNCFESCGFCLAHDIYMIDFKPILVDYVLCILHLNYRNFCLAVGQMYREILSGVLLHFFTTNWSYFKS